MAALPIASAGFTLVAQAGISTQDLVWGAPAWVVPAAVIAIGILLVVIWSYLSSRSVSGLGVVAGLLKTAAIALLAVCLLQPMRSGTRPRPQANILPVLPNPVITSSAINRTSWLVHMSLTMGQYSGGGIIDPAVPCAGSAMNAAILSCPSFSMVLARNLAQRMPQSG